MRYAVLFSAVLFVIGGCPPVDNTNQNGNDNQANSNENANDNGGGGGSTDFSEFENVGEPTDEPLLERESSAPVQSSPAPAIGDTVLINEVRFLPLDGQPQFVELKLGAAASNIADLALLNDAGERFDLPDGVPDPSPSAILVVLFDNANSIDANQIHADRGDFLDRVGGWVRLINTADETLDQVAWGPGQNDGVPLDRGGGAGPEDPMIGMTIGRFPQSIAQGRDQWTSFAPTWATPGAPNPSPGVAILLPLSGFGVLAGEVQLSWYVVDNATQYHVQVSSVPTFEAILFEATTVEPVVKPSLTAGTYFWRVEAIDENGAAADWSPISKLNVFDEIDTAPMGEIDGAPKLRGRAQGAGALVRRNLDHLSPGGSFPSFAQRKDSPLLLLESDRTDAGHSWDSPHPVFNLDCKACGMNCTLASTQMINHFFGGDLTQDRIGYEMRKDNLEGPETDLNYGHGIWPHKPLEFALGVPVPPVLRARTTVADLWRDIVTAIDAGRPTLIVVGFAHWSGTHSIVIHGYEIDARVMPPRYSFIVNDPGNHGSSSAIRGPMEFWGVAARLVRYHIVPPGAAGARQEATIGIDTDADKVYDFDEEKRFTTLVNHPDTDDDCAIDYAEISLSVHDAQHGFGPYSNGGKSDGIARMYASRGLPAPEKTNDSDGGGLPDFVEDLNMDGTIEPDKGESDPHDPKDDPRKITGMRFRNKDRDDPPTHSIQTILTEYDLQTGADGKLTGKAKFTRNYRHTIQLDAAPPRCPEPREYAWQSDETKGEVEVEGEFVCGWPEGPAIFLRDKNEIFKSDPEGTSTDPCLGGGRGKEGAILHTAGERCFPVMTDAFGVVSDAFFPSKDRVQWKTKYRYSTLDTEKNFTLEWDLVMTPK